MSRLKTLGFEQATLANNQEFSEVLGAPALTKNVSLSSPIVGKVESLQDGFNDGILDTSIWTSFADSGETEVAYRHLRCAPEPGVVGYTGVISTSNYSLVNSQISVKARSTLEPTSGCETYLELRIDGSNAIYIAKVADQISFSYKLAGTPSTQLEDFSASLDFCWRIRHSGTTLYWETSPNGQEWTIRRSVSNPFANITSMQVRLYAGETSGVVSPGEARFDDLNLTGIIYEPDKVRSGIYGLTISYGDSFLIPASTKNGGGFFRAYVKLHSYSTILGNAFMSFFRDTDFCSIVALDINQDGSLQLNYRTDSDDPDAAGTILGDRSEAMQLERWYMVEMACIGDESNTNKHLEARLDGKLFVQADVTNISAYDGFFSMGPGGTVAASYDFSVDDVAINDAHGDNNNTWCGQGNVILLPVVGDDELEKTGSWSRGGSDSGSDYGQVDDASPPDDQGTYLIAGSGGGRIDFKLANPFDYGVQDRDVVNVLSVNMRARLGNNSDLATLYIYNRAGTGLERQGTQFEFNGYFAGNAVTFKDLSFIDNFNRDRINRDLWEPTNNVTEDDGTLNIALLQEIAYWNLTSRVAYNITGGAAIFELNDVGNQALDSKEVTMQVYASDPAQNNVFFYVESTANGGRLRAYKRVTGTTTSLASVTYNSVTMRWLRIREEAGKTYWEYGPESSGPWTILTSATNPITMTSTNIAVEAGTYDAEASNTTVKFGSLRLIANPSPYYYTGDPDLPARDIYASSLLPSSNIEWTPRAILNSRVGIESISTVSQAKRDIWLFPDDNIDPTSHLTSNDWYAVKAIWYEVSGGAVVLRDDSSYGANFYYTSGNADLIRANSTEQYVTVSCADVNVMNALTSSPSNRATAISELVDFCTDNQFTGVELDFEDFGHWDDVVGAYNNFKTFVTELGNELHDNNFKLMVYVPPIWNDATGGPNEWDGLDSQALYDLRYEDFNSLPVDYLVLAAYDYQFDWSAGRPNSPLQWIADIITWARSKVTDVSKLIIGLPSAGYSGTTGAYNPVGRTYSYLSAQTGFSSANRDDESGEIIWANGGTSYAAIDDVSVNLKREVAESLDVLRHSLWHLGENMYGDIESSSQDVHITSLWAYLEYQPFAQAQTVNLTIGGVEWYPYVRKQTPYIDDRLNEQATELKFEIENIDNLDIPETDQEVILTVNGVRLFAGAIDRVTFTQLSNDYDIIGVECTDWTSLLNKRLVAASYSDMTDKQIIEAVAADYWVEEGVTTYHVSEGANVSRIVANYISGSQFMKELSRLTTRNWYVDYYKDIHYFPFTQNPAPFNITNTGEYHKNFELTKDKTRIRNRVFVRGGTELTTEPITETIKADGVQTQFLLAEKPHDLTMTVNGAPKNVGIKNIDSPDDFDFLMSFQEKYVEVASGSVPAEGDELAFTYNYDVPILVSVEDGESIAERGVYEHIIIDNQIKSTQQARDRAAAELTDFASNMIDASYITYETGLRSGQFQRVTMPNKGVDEDYIINNVTARSLGNGVFIYNVKLTNAKDMGIIRFLIDLLQQNRTVGTIDPNEKVDGLFNLSDTIDSLHDSITIDSQGTGFPWDNDAGTVPNNLKWDLGQWS